MYLDLVQYKKSDAQMLYKPVYKTRDMYFKQINLSLRKYKHMNTHFIILQMLQLYIYMYSKSTVYVVHCLFSFPTFSHHCNTFDVPVCQWFDITTNLATVVSPGGRPASGVTIPLFQGDTIFFLLRPKTH